MIQVSVKDGNGNTIKKLLFPENPKEIRFEQMIDFEVAHHDYVKWLSDTMQKKGDKMQLISNRLEATERLARTVSEFLGCEKEDLFGFPTGQFKKHLRYLSKKENLDISKFTDNLVEMHGYIFSAVNNYEPVFRNEHTYTFKFRDDEYTRRGKFNVRQIVTWRVPKMDRDGDLEDIPTGLAIAALDKYREADNMKEKYTEKIKDTQESRIVDYKEWNNVQFSLLLSIVAILARKDTDEFPKTTYDLEQRIEKRAKHFRNIDMATALDLNFFLSITTSN